MRHALGCLESVAHLAQGLRQVRWLHGRKDGHSRARKPRRFTAAVVQQPQQLAH